MILTTYVVILYSVTVVVVVVIILIAGNKNSNDIIIKTSSRSMSAFVTKETVATKIIVGNVVGKTVSIHRPIL